jgi:hypothetical protein
MNFEWRPEYVVEVNSAPSSSAGLSVTRTAPAYSAADWGIYNHFVASVADASSNTIRIVPRFLFGLEKETVEEIYGDDVDNFPIIGIFTSSTRFDRVIIQGRDSPIFLQFFYLFSIFFLNRF